MYTNICCPVCGENFETLDNLLRCKNKHSFNINKDSSVNFISEKINTNHERNIFEIELNRTKIFDQLFNEIVSTIKSYLKRHDTIDILIIKNDDGYFLNYIGKEIKNAINDDIKVNFVQISEDKKLSKAFNKNTYLPLIISSLKRLPLKKESFDCIIRFDESETDLTDYLKNEGIIINILMHKNCFIKERNLLFTGRNKGLRIADSLIKSLNLLPSVSHHISYTVDIEESTYNKICSFLLSKDFDSLNNDMKNTETTVDYLMFIRKKEL